MYLSRSEYDRGINTFSPEGRLFQLGTTVIGIKTPEGVILAAEKRITSPLLVPSSIEKVLEIDSHVGMALSGVSADSRMIMDHARLEAANHTFVYEEPIPLESITQSVSNLALKFGEGVDGKKPTMSRPFGVSILIGGIDSLKGACLYHTDPSGTYLEFDAKAIGAGSEVAMTTLESSFKKLALSILKQVMEEKLDAKNIEVVTITPKDGFEAITPENLAEFLDESCD